MDWAIAALSSAALLGAVTVVDKRLLDAYFPSVPSFNFAVGVEQAIVGLGTLAVAIPILGVPQVGGLSLALLSGILWAVGLSFFFFGLRMEEVSRATPIYGTFPLFVALIAVSFLGEHLVAQQWGAVLMVVAGTGLVSIKSQPGRRGIIGGKALLLLLMAAAVTGTAFVVNKEAMSTVPFWTMFGFRALGLGLGMMLFAIRPAVVADVLTALRDPQARRLYFMAEVWVATAAVLLQQWAINLGPVSLVSTATSSRPLFVLGISVALSTRFWNVLNEPLDRGNLALKFVSTLMVVGGIGVLTMG